MKGIVILLPVFLFSQVDFFGYVESEFDQFQFDRKVYNFGYNKLRLDLGSRPADRVVIGANINIQRFYGKTTWNFFDFLPEEIWKPVFQPDYLPDSLWLVEMPISIHDTLYLDNVYLRASFDHFDVTVGRQPISPGTGYAWNPLDIFNRKDLLDPSYEQPGVGAIRLEIPLGNRRTLDVVISPDESWALSTKMIQGKVGIESFDFTLNMAQQFRIFPYWRFVDVEQTHREEKLLGGSFVGQIAEFGLWGESLFTLERGPSGWGEYLLGADHTFDVGTYMLVEYFHNSLGASDNELIFDHYLYYFTGETHSLMQNYVFLFVNHPANRLVSLGLFGIANLDDGSAVISPQLDYNAFENVNLSLLLSRSVGDRDSEFGLQDWGLRFRLRTYF